MLRSLASPSRPTYDVCIVGSGPAAYATCVGLLNRGIAKNRIAILEGAPGLERFAQVEPAENWGLGRSTRNYHSTEQSSYEGKVNGWLGLAKPDYLTESRVRTLGGTGQVWSGWLTPLQAIDLKGSRPEFGPEWPIGACEMSGWIERAHKILALPSPEYGRPFGWRKVWPGSVTAARSAAEGRFRVELVYNRRVAFGPLITALTSSPDGPDLFLNANVLFLRRTLNAKSIDSCIVAHSGEDGMTRRTEVRAETFVLCAGSIETTRILLASELDNSLPLLGRYFTEHPYQWNSGVVKQTGRAGRRSWPFPNEPFQIRDVKAFPILIPTEAALGPNLGNFRFIFGSFHDGAAPVGLSWEMCGAWANRIRLSETLGSDRFGIPRIEVTCELATIDETTPLVALKMLRDWLDQQFGASLEDMPPFDLPVGRWTRQHRVAPGNHPAGTTRMGQSAKDGVVDSRCGVFGLDNLFVVSASVFPRSGYANPTLSLVALGLRLASQIFHT